MKKIKRFWLSLFNLFFPSEVYGKENLPEGSAILSANHYSNVDCGFMYNVNSYNDSYFLAKKELQNNKLSRKILSYYGAIFIDRDNPELKSMMEVLKKLKEGNKLTIFPEGTRNRAKTLEMLPIKSGIIFFAIKAKCPIVPVVILKKARIFRKTKIMIGEPIYYTDYYDKKPSKEDLEKLAENLKEKMDDIHRQFAVMSDKKAHKKDSKNKTN